MCTVFTVCLPCEQRFLSYMAFSVYEVIRVSCLSRSWFVYGPHVVCFVYTNQLRDREDTRMPSLTLKAMQGRRNLCSQGTVRLICSGIYIAKYMHGSILNRRWVTLPTVNCRPFASEVVLKDFEFAVYSSS